MTITYCEQWSEYYKEPLNPLSVAQARERHNVRQHYAALIGDGKLPQYVVDIAGTWVSVYFLDASGRIFLQYDFKERGGDRIFLKCAIFREFEPGTDDVVSAKTFLFEEDGQIHIRDRDLRTEAVVEKDTWASPEVNWDEYPSFGDYDNICQEERGLPRQSA